MNTELFKEILQIDSTSGKEAGLSGALTGASESYLNKNKKGNLDQVLASSTKWIAIAWIVLTLVLSLV